MPIWLPSKKFEVPESFFPSRKPTGRVKIDWSHPMTRDLVFFTSDFRTNLVTGAELTANANANYDTKNVPDTRFTYLPSTADTGLDTGIFPRNNMTCLASVSNIEQAQYRHFRLFDSGYNWSAANNFHFAVRRDNTELYVTNGKITPNFTTPTDGSSTDFAFVIDGLNTIKQIFVDSTEVASAGFFNGMENANSDQIVVCGTKYQDFQFAGDIAYSAIFHRVLSAEEIASFHAAAYQFLIPV